MVKRFGITLLAPLTSTAMFHPNPTMLVIVFFYPFDCAGHVFTKEKLHRSALRFAALFEGRDNTELSIR